MAKTEQEKVVCPLCSLMRMFAGSETETHLRSSHREFLLAVRSILDCRIKALSDDDDGEDAARKVKVK